MTETLRKISQPDGGRVETGVIQFGDDWPGLFIRGDNALYLGSVLRLSLVGSSLAGGPGSLYGNTLMELADSLQSVDIRKDGLMAEPADAVALKATDESHGGSTPSGPTKLPVNLIGDVEITPVVETPYLIWAKEQPEEERNVEIGQHRFFAIDGVGMMEGTVTRLTNESCWMKEDGTEDDFSWEVPWNATGMTGVGIIINGAEHKRVMDDAEREALDAGVQS